MRSSHTTSDTQRPRAGFSLVELLVVMAIIATLASLSFVVLGRTGEAAREAATKTSMRIISGALRERVDAFHEITASPTQADPDMPILKNSRVFRDTVADFNRRFAAANPGVALPYPLAAEAYVRKTMFKSLFPQRLEDLYGYNGTSNNGGGDDSPMLARMRDTALSQWRPESWMGREQAATSSRPEATSAELLYVILTEGDVYGIPPSEIDGIDKNQIGDTDADGNLEFLDGWGHSLQFYNWPTRLIKDDGATFTGTVVVSGNTYSTASLLISNLPEVPTPGAVSATRNRNRMDRDPDDPARWLVRAPIILDEDVLVVNGILDPGEDTNGNGRLDRPAGFWLYTTGPATFSLGGGINARSFHTDYYHDPNTATMPLVVSAGPDGDLGLYLPTVAGANRLARVIATDDACQALGDNVTNQQRGPK